MDFKIEIAKLLAAAAEISVEDAAAAVEIPAKKEMGDFAYPCFRLAKVFRKAPPMIAAELIEKIEKPAFIARMQVVGAYINFFVDKSVYAEQVLSAVLEQKESYGKRPSSSQLALPDSPNQSLFDCVTASARISTMEYS